MAPSYLYVNMSHTLVYIYPSARDNQMQHESMALGTAFSDWSELTEQYAKGMEALLRREPGASARMMEIARLMTQYSGLVAREGIPPIHQPQAAHVARKPSRSWIERAVHLLSSLGFRNGSNAALSC